MKTVAIASASSNLGRQLIPFLKEKNYTVWALTRKPFESQADLNIVNWLENPEAHSKIQRADVVINLAGEIFGKKWADFYQPNVRTTEVVSANIGKRRRDQRAIFLSYPGADQNSSNMFLRAKGIAESLLTQSQAKTIIFRFQFAIDPNNPSEFEKYLTYNGKEPIRIVGSGEQPFSVILQKDVLKFISAAIESDKSGIFHVSSPDKFTLTTYIQTLNNNPQVKIQRTPGWLAKVLSHFMSELSPTTVDLYLREQILIDSQKAINDFGVTPESVVPLYKREKGVVNSEAA